MEMIGDLDGPVAAVDRSGTVAPVGARWRLGWAVGAEDRWHVAAEEAAVRPRLIEDMPVTATFLRVPGGDVVLRAAAALTAGGRAVVLEFTNESPVPVSLAVGVTGSIHSAAARGSCLLADGRVAVDLGRAPGGTAAVGDSEVWPAVRAEPSTGDCAARSRAGSASTAAVVPLASRVPLRAAIPIDGEAVASSSPEEIAAGWRAVVERAASLELPDDVVVRAWRRGIAASVLAAGCSEPATLAEAAAVLDRVGLPEEADRARGALVGAAERSRLPSPVAAAALRALASRRLRAGRVSGLAELAGPLAEAAGDHLDRSTLEQVAAVLDTEAPAAARDARRLLAETRSASPMPDAAPTADRSSAVVRDSVAFGGDRLAGVEALLDCLVATAADQLVMAPSMPDEWIGAPVDAHGLLTRHGTLSFSVRWHGSRPALLWELAAPGGHRYGSDLDGVALRCGLDSSWVAPGSAGDALLGL